MNLDTFRSRVAQSAAAAATAARQFSSLDEMAKNDEYVQREGLNVSNKKRNEMAQSSDGSTILQKDSSLVVDLSDKFVDALSTAANPKTYSRNEDATMQIRGEVHKPQLVSSVAALCERDNLHAKVPQQIISSGPCSGRNHRESRSHHASSSYGRKTSSEPTGVIVGDRHAHILHQLHYDSDDDSSGDEQGNSFTNDDLGDVELARNNSLSDELERELNETLQHQADERKKDPHRFMTMAAGLEERESLLPSLNSRHMTDLDVKGVSDVQFTTAGQETSNALKAGLSWVKNVASPQLQSISKQILTKVSENESRYFTTHDTTEPRPMIGPRHDKHSKTANPEDEIIMTSSATFLADADMAELERIRSKHSSSQMTVLVGTCLGSLWENPRLAFVAATLIFALFVYYYSKTRSIDDVL
jgi:hypothetical protein